jgi:serpin B
MKRYTSIAIVLLAALVLLPACAATAPAVLQQATKEPTAAAPGQATAFPTAAAPAPYQEMRSELPRDLSPQVPDSDLAELVRGNTEFAFALYRRVNTGDSNIFYSPYSISLAMAMAYAGARGQTAGQMAQALRFFLPPDRLHPAFDRLALELESRSQAENVDPHEAFRLSVANSLWGQSGTPFERDFLDVLARNYAAEMRSVDFTEDPDAVRLAINDWVNRSTGQRIHEIVPVGELNALTRLVLANAVYFRAAWENPFAPADTRESSFRLLDGTVVKAPMMSAILDLQEMQGDGYAAVELPYAGGRLSMMILIPDEGRFREVEGKLNAAMIGAAFDALEVREFVHFMMPKFSFEWSAGLADGLNALGMKDALDPAAADFSGISGALNLYLSSILHKAFISVDENGTEAGASTAVIGVMGIPGVFSVDRPFIFLIRDNPTGTILFLGRMMNPA